MPASEGLFARYMNEWFVETGTYRGDGVRMALAAGFSQIVSIELSDRLFADAAAGFAERPNVRILHGDSGELLADAIRDVDRPITFWLDGHYSHGATARGKKNTPILEELEAIARHPIRGHTVLIDDVRLFGTRTHDHIPVQALIDRLLAIDPAYELRYEDGYVARDILVATPRRARRGRRRRFASRRG